MSGWFQSPRAANSLYGNSGCWMSGAGCTNPHVVTAVSSLNCQTQRKQHGDEAVILFLLSEFCLKGCPLHCFFQKADLRDSGRLNKAVQYIWKMSMDTLKRPPVYPTIKDTYQVPCVAFVDYKHVAMICCFLRVYRKSGFFRRLPYWDWQFDVNHGPASNVLFNAILCLSAVTTYAFSLC